MAKYYNNQKKTGKVAGSVFAIRFGETIERAYNPVVANPSTPLQIEARAKLKLLSQLSAVMAPVMAFPREGAVSSRNIFTKVNYPATTFASEQADITLTSIKLTRGVLALPSLTATRTDSAVNVQLSGGVSLDRVVYCTFVKQADNTLRFVGSQVVTEPSGSGVFAATFQTAYPLVIYAYGLRDNTQNARAAFGELEVVTAETVAKIIVTRTLTESDVTLTETVATSVPSA